MLNPIISTVSNRQFDVSITPDLIAHHGPRSRSIEGSPGVAHPGDEHFRISDRTDVWKTEGCAR